MKILIYNIKGGQGKTDIALNLAMTMEFSFLTNEPLSPVEMVLEPGQFLKIQPGEEIPDIGDEYDIIFDFGGYLDGRAAVALEMADYVVVPVVNEFKDVHTTINFIQEIERYTNRIVIVANRTVKSKGRDDYQDIKDIMAKHYPDYPVLNIKESRAMPNLLTEKKSIAAMVAEGGLKKYNYQGIKDQFDRLIQEFK